jgi:hypothetical protein
MYKLLVLLLLLLLLLLTAATPTSVATATATTSIAAPFTTPVATWRNKAQHTAEQQPRHRWLGAWLTAGTALPQIWAAHSIHCLLLQSCSCLNQHHTDQQVFVAAYG